MIKVPIESIEELAKYAEDLWPDKESIFLQALIIADECDEDVEFYVSRSFTKVEVRKVGNKNKRITKGETKP